MELVVFESRGMDASVYMEKNGEAITKMLPRSYKMVVGPGMGWYFDTMAQYSPTRNITGPRSDRPSQAGPNRCRAAYWSKKGSKQEQWTMAKCLFCTHKNEDKNT
jgi:hypothetical protein